MNKSGHAESEANAVAAEAVANSLEQVREILFGSQHRELARRLSRTDAHVAVQVEELRNETRRRLDALEMHINKESEALAALLESQRSAGLEALNSVGRESRESVGLLEQRVKKLEEVTARAQRDFRQQLLDQAKSFIDEVRRVRDDLGAVMERELAQDEDDSTMAGQPVEEPWEKPAKAA